MVNGIVGAGVIDAEIAWLGEAAAEDEAVRYRHEGIGAPGDIDLAMGLGAGWESGPLAGGRP